MVFLVLGGWGVRPTNILDYPNLSSGPTSKLHLEGITVHRYFHLYPAIP